MKRDITLCLNKECKIKKDCERFQKHTNNKESDTYYNSYMDFQPNENGVCNFYIKKRK